MKRVFQFLRSTRAGATSIAAVTISVMTIAGTALVTDHLWLLGKRDLLKTASDAGTVVATMQLRSMRTSMSDASVRAALQATTERYVWLNLKSNLNDDTLKQSDVRTLLDINRTTGLVDVKVNAPIGKSLLGRIVGYYGPDQIRVSSGADAGTGPVWAVLALDTSRSMSNALDGKGAATHEEQRMGIVKSAAKNFVAEVLSEDTEDETTPSPIVSIGIVPWSVSASYGVLTPTTSRSVIDIAIDQLQPVGRATASSRGIKKSRELLAVAPEGTRRVIVLLTDGQDNLNVNGGRCESRAICPKWRAAECTGAKTDGDNDIHHWSDERYRRYPC